MISFKEFLVENDQRLQALQQEIASGNAPKIMNASYYADHYSWGDLERLGLAQRGKEYAGGTNYDVWWEYSAKAPGPITLITHGGRDRVMNPGDKTDPVEVDYS